MRPTQNTSIAAKTYNFMGYFWIYFSQGIVLRCKKGFAIGRVQIKTLSASTLCSRLNIYNSKTNRHISSLLWIIENVLVIFVFRLDSRNAPKTRIRSWHYFKYTQTHSLLLYVFILVLSQTLWKQIRKMCVLELYHLSCVYDLCQLKSHILVWDHLDIYHLNRDDIVLWLTCTIGFTVQCEWDPFSHAHR